MSQRMAEAASRLLGRRQGRRRFLTRAAVVGSAVVAAPTEFLLKPRTAYAAICSCAGSSCDCATLCCDGYTEFCCQIYGTNGCPPGSLYGGWWKVDNSSFCGNGPRYYMDCHNPCGGCGCGGGGVCSGSCNGTACGCGAGNCTNRRAGCNHFRYGQCNQQLACVGPIICRVVSCTPPWVLEPNCTLDVRYDESTRFHNRPCLQQTGQSPTGQLDLVKAKGGGVRVIGWAVDPEQRSATTVRITVDGQVARELLADGPRADIAASFPAHGPDHGFNVVIPTSAGGHTICAYAIDHRGTAPDTLLGCKTVQVPAP
jgi:hypothetical protein